MQNLFVVILHITLFTYTFTSNLNFLSDATVDYDMYVLSIQWGKSQCGKNTECQKKLDSIPKNIFTLHGLWPSFKDGRRLSDCNTGSKIDVKITGENLYKEMLTYWISYVNKNDEFWDHEYNKHGYCYTQRYGKSIEDFFDTTMNLYKKYSFDQMMIKALPDIVGKRDEEAFTYQQLREKFIDVNREIYFDLDCKVVNGKKYLSEIRLYYDLNLTPVNVSEASDCNGTEPVYVVFDK